MIRYWLTSKRDEQFGEKAEDINTVYRQASELAQKGERTVSTDEMTAVQALERTHPGLPLAPGQVERREFEYIRHGTQTLMINFDVATGQVVSPSCGQTRTEEDFVDHIRRTVDTQPDAQRWHFVTDNLRSTDRRHPLLRDVSALCGRRVRPRGRQRSTDRLRQG